MCYKLRARNALLRASYITVAINWLLRADGCEIDFLDRERCENIAHHLLDVFYNGESLGDKEFYRIIIID